MYYSLKIIDKTKFNFQKQSFDLDQEITSSNPFNSLLSTPNNHTTLQHHNITNFHTTTGDSQRYKTREPANRR